MIHILSTTIVPYNTPYKKKRKINQRQKILKFSYIYIQS